MGPAAKTQHQELLKKQVGVSQQRVVDAKTKLLKHKELLGETERNIEELVDSIADLRKRICLLEEMFSAKEDLSESSDDPTRGLGRWIENRRFEKPIEAMLLEGVGQGSE